MLTLLTTHMGPTTMMPKPGGSNLGFRDLRRGLRYVWPLVLVALPFTIGCEELGLDKEEARRFPETIVSADDYFPHKDGLQWKYSGKHGKQVKEGDVDDSTIERYTNTVPVIGKQRLRGAMRIAFDETNAQDVGPLSLYFS